MEGSSVSARRRDAGRFCPPHGAEAPSAIRAEKILPDAAQLGERIDLVLRHLPERRASGAGRIVLGCGVAGERRRGCETNQRHGKRGGREAKIHGGGSGIGTPPSRIWFHGGCRWTAYMPVDGVYYIYNERGALHRPARKHAEESRRDPAAANRPRGRGRRTQ